MLTHYQGCFLGLALGDAYGAPYEGGVLERALWRLIGRTRAGNQRYTDDTQMAIDLAESLLRHPDLDQDDLARAFAHGYRWSRGYGPAAATLLKKIRAGAPWQRVNRGKFKEGSFGNGAAMRAPILALRFPDKPELLRDAVRRSAEITHAHPLAIEGAQLIAEATRLSLHHRSSDEILTALQDMAEDEPYRSKLARCAELVAGEQPATKAALKKVLKKELGNGIAATESCITALYFGLGYGDHRFETMLDAIRHLGGDVDTIGAMAGAIWGARNGIDALPPAKIATLENKARITELADRLHANTVTQG